MRAAVFCFASGLVVLLAADYVAAGNGGGLIGSLLQSAPPQQEVARERKGDRLSIGAAADNAAAIVRDPPVRATTGRQAERAGTPLAEQPQVAPRKPQPAAQQLKLPDGCEPAFSPLTGGAVSSLHARCVADLRMPLRPVTLS
jgi:hypothetical protein